MSNAHPSLAPHLTDLVVIDVLRNQRAFCHGGCLVRWVKGRGRCDLKCAQASVKCAMRDQIESLSPYRYAIQIVMPDANIAFDFAVDSLPHVGHTSAKAATRRKTTVQSVCTGGLRCINALKELCNKPLRLAKSSSSRTKRKKKLRRVGTSAKNSKILQMRLVQRGL
eukprot:563484-Rhodomonas_salina.1